MVLELAEGDNFRFYQVPGTGPGTTQNMPVLTTATTIMTASRVVGTFLKSEKGQKILQAVDFIWRNTPMAEQQRLGETIAKLRQDMTYGWNSTGGVGSPFVPGNPAAAIFVENWGAGAIPKYQQLLDQATDQGGRRVWARHIKAMQSILQENSFANPVTSTATRLAFNPLLWVVGAGALFYFINRKK
jgi:hypothetical protein